MSDPLETLDSMAWRCECGARMQSTTQLLKTGEKWITCEGMHKTIIEPTIKLMPRNTLTGEYLIGGGDAEMGTCDLVPTPHQRGHCGEAWRPLANGDSDQRSAAQPGVPQNCTHCGNPMPDAMKFCSNCWNDIAIRHTVAQAKLREKP